MKNKKLIFDNPSLKSMKQQIILASSSPRRKELLKKIIPKFKIVVSDYEEDMTRDLPPKKMALEFSRGKAEDVAKRFKSGIVIGADNFVIYNNKKLGKPYTEKKASEMLKFISGKTVKVITAICIIDIESGRIVQDITSTSVKMKNLSDEEIDWYVSTKEPLDKAGAFAMQDTGSIFVERINGCPSNVVGLPMNILYKNLKKIGYDILKKN